MTAGTFLVALTLVVLVLLLWHLRWVLLVLFGAVVVAVALDVLIVQVQRRTRLERPQALGAVLGVLLLAGGLLGQLLVPELISQFQQLGRDLPQLVSKVSDLLSNEPRLAQLNDALGEGNKKRAGCHRTGSRRFQRSKTSWISTSRMITCRTTANGSAISRPRGPNRSVNRN